MRAKTRDSKLRKIMIGLLCVGSGMVGSMGLAGTASAATIAGGTPVMSSWYANSYWYGGPLWNSYARMDCWIDSPSWSYGTNRWFRIATTIYNPRTGRFEGRVGYASANRIWNQNWTPHC
jgi:hypothetical protein